MEEIEFVLIQSLRDQKDFLISLFRGFVLVLYIINTQNHISAGEPKELKNQSS